MIRITREGFYELIETKRQIKILYLDDDTYAWPQTEIYGEMLVTSHRFHKTDCVLSVGHYRLYKVHNERNISDNIHLELEVGNNRWQGYLLLTRLPDDDKKRSRIIPTHEIITGNPLYSNRKEMQHSQDPK